MVTIPLYRKFNIFISFFRTYFEAFPCFGLNRGSVTQMEITAYNLSLARRNINQYFVVVVILVVEDLLIS